jgi:hypothetical protein
MLCLVKKQLMNFSIDVDAAACVALLNACYNNDVEAAQMLIECGVDVNAIRYHSMFLFNSRSN